MFFGASDIHIGHRNVIIINPRFMERLVTLVSSKGDCKTDHGERTNRKLRDQPFYQRGRNKKMKRF